MDRNDYESIETISTYKADDAVQDGTLVALADPPPESIKPICEISSMDGYLQNYGKILGKKAIHALAPLHVPGRDELPDFDEILRDPFPCQQHVIAATIKMLNTVGSGFIVGEMGTGKTLLGMVSVHKHAQLSRNQGGYGGNYRAIVLCPDHLIGKWCREIEETIPDASVTRFGPQGTEIKIGRRKKGEAKREKIDPNSRRSLRDTIGLVSTDSHLTETIGSKGQGSQATYSVSTGVGEFEDRPLTPAATAGKLVRRKLKRDAPDGAEWYVLGRNQAKWLSDWAGLSDGKRGFDGNINEHGTSTKVRVVDRVAVVNENGYPVYDKNGRPVMNNVTGRVSYCPKCGQIARDNKGVPLSLKDLSSQKKVAQKRCDGTYMQMVADPEKPKTHGLDRLGPGEATAKIRERYSEKKPGQEVKHGGHKWIIKECKEPLYNYTSKPYRWSVAKIVQKKLKRMFKYLVIDEVHEQKSDESAQSMACGKLIGSVNHTIALTGTIIGGYAHHLFPLMMRISPDSLKDEGFEWGHDLPFSEVYGRIDRVVTTTEKDDNGEVHGSVKSMRRAKSGASAVKKYVRPGVMPTMFGRHMIGSSMFITLEELAEELPDLHEYIGGPKQAQWSDAMKDGWSEVACEMEPAQRQEYMRVQAVLEYANKELLKTGSMKLLGAYLWTTMDYPDRPWGWGHDPEVVKAHARAVEIGKTDPDYFVPALGHTIGYWLKSGDRRIENFMGVVTPKDQDDTIVYPKEQALIDICKKQKADGTQTWVYVQMSGKRNVQPRLKALLEKEGLKVGILRADDVEPIDREEWIAAHGREFDVMISHPQLVSTGLDLFSKAQGGHNYSTLVFYETGYNLFTMRQAARRAWRIGQPRDCRVYYLYYKETMQHKAMSLMSRKMAAAQALEGEFSEDGLAAMAGEDNLQMALAKSLSERIDDSDMQRSWGKIKSGPKKARPVKASPLDALPPDLQLIGEGLIESQTRPVPAEAEAEFAEIADRIAKAEGVPAAPVKPEPKPTKPKPAKKPVLDIIPTTPEDFAAKAIKVFVPDDDMDDDDELPELTEDILAKMFGNMMANGLWDEAV